MQLSNEKKQRLDFILKRIENGKALALEYQEYEDLLLESGIVLSKIRKPLSDAGINTWQEYIDERAKVQITDTDNVKKFLVIILGAIIALGIGVIIGIKSLNRIAQSR